MILSEPGHEVAKQVAAEFRIPRGEMHVHHLAAGHINDTFVAAVHGPGHPRRYIVQRVNRHVFPNVPELMLNIERVTSHLRRKLEQTPGSDPERETLTIIPTQDGQPFLKTAAGDFWRCYVFIGGARTYDVAANPGQAREAARAFGRFQRLLTDLPGPPLFETIPHFHDTSRRFAALEAAILADRTGRVRTCGPEIDFAISLKSMTGRVVGALESGDLPWRVTHNDTKINNVMLDDATGAAVCVIDLDVVMSGSVLYDFGDQVRTAAGRFHENERDLSKVGVDVSFFEGLVKGYLEEAGDFLTPAEVDLVPFSGLLMTYTIGIRFLTDYLQGDVYFRTSRPDENLDRCRTQFALVRSIQTNEAAMNAIVRTHWARRSS